MLSFFHSLIIRSEYICRHVDPYRNRCQFPSQNAQDYGQTVKCAEYVIQLFSFNIMDYCLTSNDKHYRTELPIKLLHMIQCCTNNKCIIIILTLLLISARQWTYNQICFHLLFDRISIVLKNYKILNYQLLWPGLTHLLPHLSKFYKAVESTEL